MMLHSPVPEAAEAQLLTAITENVVVVSLNQILDTPLPDLLLLLHPGGDGTARSAAVAEVLLCPASPQGRRQTDGLPACCCCCARPALEARQDGDGRTGYQICCLSLLLLRSVGHSGPAGRRRTDGRTDGRTEFLLLRRSTGHCGPAGRRRTDGLPHLLLQLRLAGP